MGIDTEGQLDRGQLRQLVGKAGGQFFDTTSADQVGKAFANVASSLQNQYVVSYASFAERGSNDVEVSVGGSTKDGSYVTGSASEGASVKPTAVRSSGGRHLPHRGRQVDGTRAGGLFAALLVYASSSSWPSKLEPR